MIRRLLKGRYWKGLTGSEAVQSLKKLKPRSGEGNWVQYIPDVTNVIRKLGARAMLTIKSRLWVDRTNKFSSQKIITRSSEFCVAMYLKYFLYSFPNKIKEKSTQEMLS